MTCLWDQQSLFEVESNFWPVHKIVQTLVHFPQAAQMRKNEQSVENAKMDATTMMLCAENSKSSSLLDELSSSLGNCLQNCLRGSFDMPKVCGDGAGGVFF
jgi:hypothetical protein